MTVGQLREAIKRLPDDYRIILDNGKLEADDYNEVISASAYSCGGGVKDTRVVVLQTKDDMDIKEEIESMISYYMSKASMDTCEIFEMLDEKGFNERDYNKCDQWVKDLYNEVRKEVNKWKK